MKNILVTGGAGYIGSHTVIELIQQGYNPIILDDFRNSDGSIIERLETIAKQKIRFHTVDVCNLNEIVNALSDIKIDGIIHFAAYKAVGESVQNPLKYYHNNIQGLVSTLKFAEMQNVSNFIFSSSCTVYGEPNGIKEVTEDTNSRNANSPYGNTKVVGEQILRDFHKSGSKINFLSLRYFNPIGAHPSGTIGEWPIGKPNNLLPFITQTAVGVHPELTVFGNDYPTIDGSCVRDYIHVVDLANAHALGLSYLDDKPAGFLDFINVGTGIGTSVLQIIASFETCTGEKLKWKFGERRAGDVAEIYANANKIKETLNWSPKYSLEDAINHAWKWENHIRKIH